MKPIPLILCLFFISSLFAQKGIGIFDGHGDAGTSVKPSSATYFPQTQQYILSGAGYNVWNNHDEFQYVWKQMKGNFILYTRAEFQIRKSIS